MAPLRLCYSNFKLMLTQPFAANKGGYSAIAVI